MIAQHSTVADPANEYLEEMGVGLPKILGGRNTYISYGLPNYFGIEMGPRMIYGAGLKATL